MKMFFFLSSRVQPVCSGVCARHHSRVDRVSPRQDLPEHDDQALVVREVAVLLPDVLVEGALHGGQVLLLSPGGSCVNQS